MSEHKEDKNFPPLYLRNVVINEIFKPALIKATELGLAPFVEMKWDEVSDYELAHMLRAHLRGYTIDDSVKERNEELAKVPDNQG